MDEATGKRCVLTGACHSVDDFILRHVDDLREIFMLHSGEVVALSAAAGGAA